MPSLIETQERTHLPVQAGVGEECKRAAVGGPEGIGGVVGSGQRSEVGCVERANPDLLLAVVDQNVAKARTSLSKTTDDYLLTTNWRLKAGGKVVADDPRHVVLRDTFNHLAHHRGQLTVYLRLNDCKVPAIYGPSA